MIIVDSVEYDRFNDYNVRVGKETNSDVWNRCFQRKLMWYIVDILKLNQKNKTKIIVDLTWSLAVVKVIVELTTIIDYI